LSSKCDKRTEREQIIDKLLMLKVIDECEKKGIEIDGKKLMNLIYIIQTVSEAQGIETFHYKDWVWKDDELNANTK